MKKNLKNLSVFLVLVVSVLILAVIIRGTLNIFNNYFLNKEITANKKPFVLESEQFEVNNIGGKIYLALLPVKKAEHPSSIIEQFRKPIYSSKILKEIDIYYIDVFSNKIEKFLVDDNENGYLKFSADGKKLVFVSDRNNFDSNIKQVYTVNPDLSDIKQITFSNDKPKKSSPVFSPDGKQIVFTVLTANNDDNEEVKFSPESSSIYITDLNGNEHFVINGSSPMFSPDGKFLLALKSEGLYAINLESNDSKILIPLPDNAKTKYSTSMKLSLSADGSMLAWSNALKNELYLLKIISWEPFYYNKKTIIASRVFWPVFSPDGKHLAFQEVGGNNIPKLTIIDLKNFKPMIKFNLKNYLSNAMWVTEWR
ncbi:MAG: hypothetical protein AAB858_01005 [Patescibacteria group bacterium]